MTAPRPVIGVLVAPGTDAAAIDALSPALDGRAEVVVVGVAAGEVPTLAGAAPGPALAVDRLARDVDATSLAALAIPAGPVAADVLRRDDGALDLVRAVHAQGGVLAASGHGPLVLVEAGLASGRRLASAPGARNDLANAGADWTGEPLVVHDRVVTVALGQHGAALVAAVADVLAGGPGLVDVDAGGGASRDEVLEQSFPASDPPPAASAVGEPARRGRGSS